MKLNFSKKNKSSEVIDNPILKDIKKRREVKKQNFKELILGLVIIVLLNIVGAYAFHRFDLTTEKRYTLSQTTKKLLKNLDDMVYFKVYLEGDFPAGFKKLRNETREMLDEFKAYSNNIDYKFVDPLENAKGKSRNEIIQQMYKEGLEPMQIQVKEGSGTSNKIVFPCATVVYKNRKLPLSLMKSRLNANSTEVLNEAVQNLEYELSNVIRKHTTIIKPSVGFIVGHGELDSTYVEDFSNSLSEYYTVGKVKIDGRLKSLKDYKAIIIAKPDSAFNDKDKFVIDQFIMKGGKVLWLIDQVYADMDSLKPEMLGFPLTLNLDDQLFKYGVRINNNLIQSMYCMKIPIINGQHMEYYPWYYFPLVGPASNHPIVNNLNIVKLEFASLIDTISVPDIKKTILLSTSKFSRSVNAPMRIGLDLLKKKPEELRFNSAYLPVAVLLEGKFSSLFKNRLPTVIMEDKGIDFKEQGVYNKMIVVSDGDIIKNQIGHQNGVAFPFPLGFDRHTNMTFGNKSFLSNCIDFLCDDTGLISIRNRELKLRLLDSNKIIKQRAVLQFVNVALPIFLILIFGFIQGFLKKRKYA